MRKFLLTEVTCLKCFYNDVKEAVRRLPPKDYHERTFRIVRAMQYSLMHRILPKEQWTKFEDDVPYLTPYLDEINKEKKEKEEWEKTH